MLNSEPTNFANRRVRIIHRDYPADREQYLQLHSLLKIVSERYALFASEREYHAEFYVLFIKPWTEDFAVLYRKAFGKAPTVLPIPYQYDYLLETSQMWPLKRVSD
ncbi:hypothetical protein [Spirosoma flavum]|uniref:DUF695 domain-containing protein n=1 Tax=Spirosoma flavum TaxID=2048557 RepID=A0ABW6AIF3_9BACT